MATIKNEKLKQLKKELKEEILLTKRNIQILKKAKKKCTCEGQKPHYHELINYDAESGDEYFETSDAKHQRFIEKLNRQVVRLRNRVGKLKS